MGARPPVNRSTATRIARGAQGAAVLLAIGAGTIIALGLPDRPLGPPAEGGDFSVDLPERGSEPLIPRVERVDFTGLVERMRQVDNAPTPPREEPAEETDPEQQPAEASPDADPTIADRVAYLGDIQVGEARLALLRVDGRQRTVRPGSVIPGSGADGRTELELVRVDGRDVTVRAAGAQGPGTVLERSGGGHTAPSELAIAAPPPARIAPPAEDRLNRAADRLGEQNGAVLERDPLKRRIESIERLYQQGRIDEERYKTMIERAREQLERAQEAREGQADN